MLTGTRWLLWLQSRRSNVLSSGDSPRVLVVVAGVVLLLVMGACSNETADSGLVRPDNVPGLVVASPFETSVFAEGFNRPTQMIFGPTGDLFVAELNGAENDGTGRIVRVSADDVEDRQVLQTGLDKPTGIAITGSRLWIMERQRLSVTTLVPNDAREIVADELPFNGRSEGTLTVTPDGRLLYNTSGSKRGAERVEGSGMIFAIDNPEDGPSPATVVASGFKHAYAHLFDVDGQLWTVEMTDGTFDQERAADELVAISPGDDAGWPQCVDNNRPVVEFGGTAELCDSSPPSHALFPPGATPTSFVVAPWDDDLFVVALWLRGEVVTVPRSRPGATPHAPTVIIEGIESPQHILADGDGLLISDHATGIILAVDF